MEQVLLKFKALICQQLYVYFFVYNVGTFQDQDWKDSEIVKK